MNCTVILILSMLTGFTCCSSAAASTSATQNAAESRPPAPFAKVSAELKAALYSGDSENAKKQIAKIEKMVANSETAKQKAAGHFYAGLCWRNFSSGSDDRMVAFDKSVKHLEKAIELNPKNAEAHAVLSHVLRSLIGSGNRNHDIIQKSIEHRERAFELAPENPRILMLEASALIFIPEDRGGNIAEGIRYAFEAAGRFAMESDDDQNWGEADNWALLGAAFRKNQKPKVALRAYQKAVEVQPNWILVRDQIIPSLKK